MRLKSEEISAIKETATEHFGKNVKVYVFGSRTDDSKSGGDIDIYLETSLKKDLFLKKIKYLVALKKKIGERRIDVVVNNNTSNKLIFDVARKQGVKI